MRLVCAFALCVAAFGAPSKPYAGPPPPEADKPFLLHATKLTATEAVTAKQEHRDKQTVLVVNGVASTVHTPLAEPIFILKPKELIPEHMRLYRATAKDNTRELDRSESFHLTVTAMSGGLYRIELSEALENGEYCLATADTERVFCFAVY